MRTNGFASTIVSRRWLRCHAVIPRDPKGDIEVRTNLNRDIPVDVIMKSASKRTANFHQDEWCDVCDVSARNRHIPPTRYWRMLLRHYISHSSVIKPHSQPRYLSLLARRQQSIWLTLDALWFICAPNIESTDRRMRNRTFNPRVS